MVTELRQYRQWASKGSNRKGFPEASGKPKGDRKTMSGPLHIDGSRGEGGGQMLRTALSLSVVTGRAFEIQNLRARRRNPGLAPQHLHTVRVFREISDAHCRGDEPGSMELSFVPGTARAGEYEVKIPTAGSVTLVLQAVSLPLALQAGDSRLRLEGGTHVPWSPPFNYIESCWLFFMERLGLSIEAKLERAGFYPRGGGLIEAHFRGSARLTPLRLTERGELRALEIVSMASRLPPHIRQRQASRARTAVLGAPMPPAVQLMQVPAASPGSVVAITGVFDATRVTTSALGARGKPAERVAEEAAYAFNEFLERPGAVDPYLADQLLLPLALAEGASEYTTTQVSQHLVTQAEMLRMFLERKVEVRGLVGEPGRVLIGA